ncbi:Gas vesicle synthesis protein GvpL/GvpF [Streptomyces sp. YIM 130001]|uniref:GvpL/GvpF family gas vesicle protein n=1 Tax=Streptomyces sp. YIM 130001 TaxID=2259644 RepID=UPI000E65084D|nr:GvpL/GvpF family gas vesicle protein [Streptomyces sp. YIM 130001]RII12407.1 Gas vesicle synthesis protein GvpL/GvpF [Streptomyces sp. YIM 130001]
MGDELRYLYAVCRPFEAPLQAELRGVSGAPVRTLRHGELVAVVSAVPRRAFAATELRTGHDFAGTPQVSAGAGTPTFAAHSARGPIRSPQRENPTLPSRHLPADPGARDALARAHHSVIDALTTVTSPVPLPVGTVLPDDSGVRALLEADGERLRHALDRLDGRVEWEVTAQLTAPSGELTVEPSDEGERAEIARAFGERLHALLARHADATHTRSVEPSTGPRVRVLDASYLVPRRLSEAFVELVDRTGDQQPHVRVDLAGPRAGYSFTGDPAAAGS